MLEQFPDVRLEDCPHDVPVLKPFSHFVVGEIVGALRVMLARPAQVVFSLVQLRQSLLPLVAAEIVGFCGVSQLERLHRAEYD